MPREYEGDSDNRGGVEEEDEARESTGETGYDLTRAESEERVRAAEEQWLDGGWREGLGWAMLRDADRDASAARKEFKERSEGERWSDELWRLELKKWGLERVLWRVQLLSELGQVLRELTIHKLTREQIIEGRDGVLVRVHNVINDEEREYVRSLFDRWAGSEDEEGEGGS